MVVWIEPWFAGTVSLSHEPEPWKRERGWGHASVGFVVGYRRSSFARSLQWLGDVPRHGMLSAGPRVWVGHSQIGIRGGLSLVPSLGRIEDDFPFSEMPGRLWACVRIGAMTVCFWPGFGE